MFCGIRLLRCCLHNLAYNVYDKIPGSGAPILIMHGLFGNKQNWASLGKALNAKTNPTREVISVDARNHGDSPHTATHSYEEMADDVREFLQSRNISKSIVIGHSMGGRAMMTFAMQYPEMVEKAVIVDISPIKSNPKSGSFEGVFDAMLRMSVPDNLDMKAARQMADDQLKQNISHNETRGFIMMNFTRHPDGKYGWKLNVKTLQDAFDEHISRFPPHLLSKQCDVPTLFIGGSHSEYMDPDSLPAIQKLFPKSDLVFVNAGHLVHIEQPNEFLNLVLKYINTA